MQTEFDSDLALAQYVLGLIEKQNCLSKTPEQGCRYRSENGSKCAAGQLITDEQYDESFERAICHPYKSGQYVEERISKILAQNGYDPIKIRILQMVHDHSGVFNEFLIYKTRLESLLSSGVSLADMYDVYLSLLSNKLPLIEDIFQHFENNVVQKGN